MEIGIEATGLSAEDVQAAIDAAWADARRDPKVSQAISDLLVNEPVPDEAPFQATPAAEGFGAVEMIVIAAAGRLVAAPFERVIVKIFDDVIWPKLVEKFGQGVQRKTDAPET